MEQLFANIGQQVKVQENKYLGLWAEYLRELCGEKSPDNLSRGHLES